MERCTINKSTSGVIVLFMAAAFLMMTLNFNTITRGTYDLNNRESLLIDKTRFTNLQEQNINCEPFDTSRFPHDEIQHSVIYKEKLVPFNKYWSNILHFVPDQTCQDCRVLFTTATSKHITPTKELLKTREITDVVHSKLRTPEHEKLTLTYQALAQQDFVKTVCEIGFNVGQSAMIWLTSKPGLKLYSFDISKSKPLIKMRDRLKGLFPNNFELIIGDSKETVPKFAERGIKCDIVSIDGSHTYPDAKADFINAKDIAAKEHIIIFDDIFYPGVNKAWQDLRDHGLIHHLFDCWVPGRDVDFGIAYYKNI